MSRKNLNNRPVQLHVLSEELWFPPVSEALPDGLVALGGDLSPERLLLAYRSGIFPWFNEEDPLLWWSPDPRCVLFPPKLKISKSMQQVIKKGTFEFRVNTAFPEVIDACSKAPRAGQQGTWITDDIRRAYIRMHRLGHAWSAEAWQEGQLVGGLYGIWLGNAFFGESMFSQVSNASKFAFIHWVHLLQEKGVVIIDCQMHTSHLESMGAEMIPREAFIRLLAEAV